jgi:hypothetical protein
MAKKKTKTVTEEVVTPVVEQVVVVTEAPKTAWEQAVERAKNKTAEK